MIKLLVLLLTGCWHRWKIIKAETLRSTSSNAVGSRYILQCERCGNVKNRDIL